MHCEISSCFLCLLALAVVLFVCNIYFQLLTFLVCDYLFKVCKSFLTFLFSIQCVQIISWMFLFRVNGVITSFLKISLTFSLICKIFLMILVMFGRNRLHVSTRSCHVSFSVIRSILLSSLILSRCALINDGWYPCFTKLFFISLRLLFKST